VKPDSEAAQKPTETCDRCGREAAGVIADLTLCESCYHEETSCCGRFGEEEEILPG
jgi:ribosomal protein S14